MCVNNLSKVATQWNSGATRDSNRGRRVLIPSALTTTPPSHTAPSLDRSPTTGTLFPVTQLYTPNAQKILYAVMLA